MRRKSYLKGLGLGIFVTALIMSLSSGKAKGEMSDEEIIKRAEKLGMVSENAMLLTEAQSLADNAQKKGRTPADEQASEEGREAASDNKVSQNATVSDNGEIIRPEDISGNKAEPNSAAASEKEDRAAVAGAGTADSGKKQAEEQASKEQAAKEQAAKEQASREAASKEKASEEASKAKKEEEAREAAKAAADAKDEGNNNGNGETVTITVNSGESSISVASKMVQAGLISDARQFDSYLVLAGYDRKLVVGSHPIPKGASAEEMGKILTTKQ